MSYTVYPIESNYFRENFLIRGDRTHTIVNLGPSRCGGLYGLIDGNCNANLTQDDVFAISNITFYLTGNIKTIKIVYYPDTIMVINNDNHELKMTIPELGDNILMLNCLGIIIETNNNQNLRTAYVEYDPWYPNNNVDFNTGYMRMYFSLYTDYSNVIPGERKKVLCSQYSYSSWRENIDQLGTKIHYPVHIEETVDESVISVHVASNWIENIYTQATETPEIEALVQIHIPGYCMTAIVSKEFVIYNNEEALGKFEAFCKSIDPECRLYKCEFKYHTKQQKEQMKQLTAEKEKQMYDEYLLYAKP